MAKPLEGHCQKHCALNVCVGCCTNCLGGREHKTSTAPLALCSELSSLNMKKLRLQTSGCCFAMLRTALFACLMLSPWHLSLWGPDCRSWSIASRGTTCRSLLNSALNLGFHFVVQGNLMVRTWWVLYILTSKCASRHKGEHFFDISTSKSGPDLVCFVHFEFEMCFAPQRCALFRHLNFQKWSGPGVFCTFWIRNVLRAKKVCTFSTSQLPKVVRAWCVLYILTSKCASRHNGVQFFISHLASWLRTRRFSESTFRPSGATNRKNIMFRDFPTFSRTCIFFLLTLSLLWSSLFYSSLLSDSSRLCFSSVHIVGLNFLRSYTIYHISYIIYHISYIHISDTCIYIYIMGLAYWKMRRKHPYVMEKHGFL